MTRHAIPIGTVVLALTMTGACAAGEQTGPRVETVTTPTAPPTTLLLAAFDRGIGAVPPESSVPLWLEPDAVAALDGSAVFSIHHDGGVSGDRLVRIDPKHGTASAEWPLLGGLSISAVAPAGRWVALTNRVRGYGSQGRASTEVVVFDPHTGSEVHRLPLVGDVQPEAFSVDGARVFALDYRGDHYRVQTLDLATGERYDTSDRDKLIPPEDMHGQSVRGVMSADRTLLATLYRNPGNVEEPAFVHILDLQHGWSYCADLPAPFGTGPPGTDAIALTPTDTIVVGAAPAGRLAEIHIDDVAKTDLSPVRVAFRAGALPPTSPALASISGFEFVITTLAA